MNSPQNSFDERDKEVKRLELAVKRAESMVNKDRQDMTEREALLKLTSEEKEKRNQGKQHWWLKECKCCHHATFKVCYNLRAIQPKSATC